MGEHIQLKAWLIAQPLGETESVDAHVVSSPFKPGTKSDQADQSNDPFASTEKQAEPENPIHKEGERRGASDDKAHETC